MSVEYVWVYTPIGSQKIVYTPIFDSETINVIVYSIFRGSPKLKVEPFILILLDIKMHNTVDEKYIWECVGVIIITTKHKLNWYKRKSKKLNTTTKYITYSKT